MKKVTEMHLGSETVYSDVCSMIRELHQLESCIATDGPQTAKMIDQMNNVLSRLPPDSPLYTQWNKTQSQYEETTALINRRRLELTEARIRLAPDDKDSRRRIETPPRSSCDNSTSRSSTQQVSHAENRSVPVCHVKPTQILNEMTSSSPTAPFDLRTYLIDKNAPVTEPVFQPHLTSLVQDSTAKLPEGARRRSSDDVAPANSLQPVRAPLRSTSKPAAAALLPVRSRWKVLKKKAVGLFTDGFGGGRSPSNSVSTESLQRLECSIASTCITLHLMSEFNIENDTITAAGDGIRFRKYCSKT